MSVVGGFFFLVHDFIIEVVFVGRGIIGWAIDCRVAGPGIVLSESRCESSLNMYVSMLDVLIGASASRACVFTIKCWPGGIV